MVANRPVCTRGVGAHGAEPMFYVAITPPIVEHPLLAPGNPGSGYRTHQSVEPEVMFPTKFQVTGIQDRSITSFEYPDHILCEIAV